MIVERRQILFSPEALLEAVRLYSALPQQSDVPFGLIASVSVKPAGASPVLDIVVQQSGASQLRKVPLAGLKIMAALLLLCRKRQIPVPKQAKKNITVEGQGLVLTVVCSDYGRGAQPEASAA